MVIAAFGSETVWSQRIDGIQSKFEESNSQSTKNESSISRKIPYIV